MGAMIVMLLVPDLRRRLIAAVVSPSSADSPW